MDRFKSMKELENVTVENEDWEIETEDKDSNVSILAIHGGGIEPATTELAQVIADKGNYNYFSFKGLRSKGNNELHVTSTNYDDPQAIKIVEKSERAIALH
ncbi:TPA: poly-gamma-glutamate hydrolase family protein, partial [Pseudomonas aeruginosa]|nr:poly-gamma-glutamate hydrolase family protein [Pseudomonas aeruginosa]